MKMVDTKLTGKEAKAQYGPITAKADKGPTYPWGTSLSIEKAMLDKLGVDVDNYSVGQKLTLTAQVEVTNLSKSERQGGGEDYSMGLQITSMGLEATKKTKFGEFNSQNKKGPGE
jgi:hypothetical protein